MKTTLDHVRWAYRLLLEREPESEEVCQTAIGDFPTVSELRNSFLSSREFANKNPKLDIHGGKSSTMEIDMNITDEELSLLFMHVKMNWERLGREEPHWSVLVSEKFKQLNIHATKEQFYESGYQQASSFLDAVARNYLPLKFGTILDFGCGVGRVTHVFARHFSLAMGVDISSSHLDVANNYYVEKDLQNVLSILLTQPQSMDKLRSYDAFYSMIALQHNPPPVMEYLLKGLMQKLNRGGVGMFQVPIYSPGYKFKASDYIKGMGEKRGIEMHVLPLSRIHAIISDAGCELVETVKDYSVGPFGTSQRFLVTKP